MTTAIVKSESTTLDSYHPDVIASTMQMAKMLVQSKLTPRGVDSPEKAFYIIMKGRELGVPPIRSLERIHIIDGKTCMAAELMLERFRQRGGHSAWVESTNKTSTIKLKAPNGDEHTEQFTWEDATTAGVNTKDNWRKWPKAMLRARCSSAGLRAMGEAEGMYDPDELGAVTNEEGEVLAVMPTPKAFQPEARIALSADHSANPVANSTGDAPKAAPAPTAERQPGEDDDEMESSAIATSETPHDSVTGEVLEESDEEDLLDVVPCYSLNQRTQEWEPVNSQPKLSPAQLKMIQVLRGKLGHHLDKKITKGTGVDRKIENVKDGKYRDRLFDICGKRHTNELSRREASDVIDRLTGMWEKLDAKLDRGAP